MYFYIYVYIYTYISAYNLCVYISIIFLIIVAEVTEGLKRLYFFFVIYHVQSVTLRFKAAISVSFRKASLKLFMN